MFVCVSMCHMCVGVSMHTCAGSCGSHRRLSDSLKLELDVAVGCLMDCWSYKGPLQVRLTSEPFYSSWKMI